MTHQHPASLHTLHLYTPVLLPLCNSSLIATLAQGDTVKTVSPKLPNMLYPILRGKSVTLVLKLFNRLTMPFKQEIYKFR